MTKLKAIDPKNIKPKRPKMLVYGDAGTKKTLTSIEFPSVYYIDTEGGATQPAYTEKLKKSKAGYFGQEQGSLDFNEIIEQVKALATQNHHYKTIVIDSISKIFNDYVTKELERITDKNPHITSTYGAEKKPAILQMKKLLRWIDRVDMNVILISHEKPLYENGEEIGKAANCWDDLKYYLDIVFQTYKQGNSFKARVTKSRLSGFQDLKTIEWDYKTLSNLLGKSNIESNVSKLELATEDQIKEISLLIQNCNISKELQEKWFNAANCEDFRDMEAEKIQSIIDMLNKKKGK